MIRTRPVPALALAALIVCTGTVGAQGKLPPDIPVTTTIADVANGWYLHVRSDRQGAYVRKMVNKVKQVESALVATPHGYDFMLTTYYSSKGSLVDSSRTVFFDLSEQTAAGSFNTPALGTGAAGEPLPYGLATAHIAVKCSQSGINMVKLAEGQSAVCTGSFRFRARDNNWYRLAFNPENVPGVDPINVTCEIADNSGCKVWTLAPTGWTLTGDNPNVSNRSTLLRIDSSGTVLAVGGNYNISFSITIAR